MLGRRRVIESSDDEDVISIASTSTSTSSATSTSRARASSGDSASDPGVAGDTEATLTELIGGLRVDTQAKTSVHKDKKTLMPHQRTGVEWLLNLYKIPSGGILADDMGLGKTFQVASFIHTLVERRQAKRILIVAPKTLLGAWENEISTELEMDLTLYGTGTNGRATTKRGREAIMEGIARYGGILMMTYGLIQRDAELVRTHQLHDADEGPFWDVCVMDEGHQLKNAGNKTRVEIEKLDARMRLLITGTPIQNNLMELHSLFDLVKEGLLGDKAEFKDTFEKPIKRGTSKDASRREQDAGAMASVSLQKTYAPFMLRRTKEEVMGTTGNARGSGGNSSQVAPSWQKKDIVVWLRLTETQLGLYKAFLRSKSVQEVLNQSRSALASLAVLKKICKHPALLADGNASNGFAFDSLVPETVGGMPDPVRHVDNDDWNKNEGLQELQELRESTEWKQLTQSNQHDNVVSASCKTLFVMGLLDKLIASGHRALVFSESKVMLNILEEAIAGKRWKYLRIDGDVDGAERHARVTQFQEDASFPVFLLTSQVGGLGLTLTAADRVILCDPSWNPSVDNQSVDRACRLGQTRDVLVYRLVTCGTIEDKVYQKQVFKGAIFKAGTEQGEQQRYFNESDTQVVVMQDLFSLAPGEFLQSSTQKELEARHRHLRRIPSSMQREIDDLSSIESYVGFSDHDLLYTEVSAVSESIVGAAQVFTSASTPIGSKGSMGSIHYNGSNGAVSSHDDALAAMFDKSLSLNRSTVPPVDEARLKLETLKADLAKQEKLLINASLLMALPDGGSKIRETVYKMRNELRDMETIDKTSREADPGTPLQPHVECIDRSELTEQPDDCGDLLAAVHRKVSEPTPMAKSHTTTDTNGHASHRTTSSQEKTLVLRSKMKRAKADLHRRAKDLEAYRLGTHVTLDEDARRKAEVEESLDTFIRAKTAYENAIQSDHS